METYIDEEGYEVEVWNTGTKRWYKNGKLHRDNDKPAIVSRDGSKRWFKNGKLHRDGDKPAILRSDGARKWCKNGELHRENNPSFINRRCVIEYNLNNLRYRTKEYWVRLLLLEY